MIVVTPPLIVKSDDPPFTYEMPTQEGKFGRYQPNLDFCKQWLKENFYWRLQASANNATWADANPLMKIDLNWNSTSLTSKLTLTLNTTNAPRSLYYRFDLACNATMKHYLNDSTMSQWTMIVPVGDREMTIFFNWSDIKTLVQNGQVWFKHGKKAYNGQDYFWFRIQTVNRIAVGKVFVVDPTYGFIGDQTSYSYEYDTEEGMYPDAIRLGTSEYYAVVSTGDIGTENDGYVRTFKVSNDTAYFQSVIIDSLEYDATDGYYPSICLVSGDYYAICYYDDTANKQTIVTVQIWDNNGSIASAVTDTLQLTNDGVITSKCKMLPISGNLFCAVYSDVTTDLWLETFNITTDGLIDATPADAQEIDANDGINPSMVLVDSNTVAVAYDAGTAGANDGWLSTWNITSPTGAITATAASSWEYNGNNGVTPYLYHVSGDVYVIAHQGADGDGWVNTTSIYADGSLSKTVIDTLEFDTADAKYPYLFEISFNAVLLRTVYGVSYQWSSADGVTKTFTIDTNGQIGAAVIDSLEFDTANNINTCVTLHLKDMFWLTVYTGTGNDGWAKTYQIYTNIEPQFSSPYLANGSIDVALTPTLSVNLTDTGDIVNLTWFNNATGSWVNFGTNNSIYTYGAISDSKTSWEYDAQEGYYPDVIRLGSSNYYAIVSTGDTGTEMDGYIRVVQAWNNNGSIRNSLIDSYEYDASDGYYPRIRNIAGDIYGIAYYADTANVIKVVTVDIDDADGDITGAIIDTKELSFDTVNTYPLDFIRVSGQVFAVAYSNITTVEGILETIWINDSGTINDSSLDCIEFNASYALHPRMCMLDSNTVVIAHYASTGYGWISTFNISSVGYIGTTRSDSLMFDSAVGTMADIIRVYKDMYVMAYEGSGNDGWMKTVRIDETGDISGTTSIGITDSYEFDKADGGFQRLLSLNNSLFVLTYQGTGADGWMKTISISKEGDIGCFEYDELEFDTTDSVTYAPIISMGGDYYLFAWQATGNDGFVGTVKIGNETSRWGRISEPIDSWEYDAEEAVSSGGWKGICQVNNTDIYISAARGNTGADDDGVVRTFQVQSDGTIVKSIIDTLTYDSGTTGYNQVYHIPGTDKYVLCYEDTSTPTLVTFKVQEDGQIGAAVIDTQTTSFLATYTGFFNFTDNVYVVTYSNGSGGTTEGLAETFWVGDDGVINNTRLDFQEIDGTFGKFISMVKIDSNTVAFQYVSTSNSGEFTIRTYNITTDGLITNTQADSWAHEPDPYYYNELQKIGQNIISTLYVTSNGDVFFKTLTVSDAGVITKVFIDSLFVCDGTGYATYLVNSFYVWDPRDYTNGMMGCTFRGKATGNVGENDGYLATYDVKTNGEIGRIRGWMKYTLDQGVGNAFVIHLSDENFFVLYSESDRDGWVKTFKIYNQTGMEFTQTASFASANNHKYWWKLTAQEWSGVNNVSVIYTFTTIASANTAPELTLDAIYPTTGVDSYTAFKFNVTWTDDDGDDPTDGYLKANISRGNTYVHENTTETNLFGNGTDDDWSTYQNVTSFWGDSGGPLGESGDYMYFNYTIPAGASSAKWEFKCGSLARQNITVPANAIDESMISIRAWIDEGIAIWVDIYYDGSWFQGLWDDACIPPYFYDEEINFTCNTWSTNQSMSWLSGANLTGAKYQYSTTLTTGIYTYTFWAYDGVAVNSSGPHNGPTVVAMSFSLMITQSDTAALWFNMTSFGTYGSQADVDASGQTDVIPAIDIENQGNVPVNLTIRINASMPAGLSLKYDEDNNPVGATTITVANNMIEVSLTPGGTEEIWVWMDFVNAPPGTGQCYIVITSFCGDWP